MSWCWGIRSWSYLCSEVFSTFGIILTICSSNCKRPKTEFIVLINHVLTFNHPSGSINRHELLDHLELCLDLLPFRHYLQVLGCEVALPTLQPVLHYQREIIPYSRESNGRNECWRPKSKISLRPANRHLTAYCGSLLIAFINRVWGKTPLTLPPLVSEKADL